MKYGLNAKVYSFMFSKMLISYYKKYLNENQIKPYIKDVKKEYKEMILRTEGIGGNSLEGNLVGACYFFAMAKKIPGMTPKLMDDIVDKSFNSKIMIKAQEKKRKSGFIFSDKYQDIKVKEAELSHNSKYKMDWEFTYEKGKDEFYMNFTKCGVCKLAEIENVLEYLPSMCKMDYPKFKSLGGKLIRTKTLAKGDDCCDFHLVRIKDK